MSPPKNKDSQELQLNWIIRTVSVLFVVGILLSFKLWISDRFFPLAPVWNSLLTTPPFDIVLAILLILLLCSNFFSKRWIAISTVILLIYILAGDQMRWQPWVYIYSLVILLFAVRGNQEENRMVLNSLQLGLPGIYFWSGVHKLNSGFISSITHNIFYEIFAIEFQQLPLAVQWFGYLVPLTELFICVALILKRTRKAGVYLAIVVHLSILLVFGPLGSNTNTVIWPWNVAMIILVTLIFFPSTRQIVIWSGVSRKFKVVNSVILLLIWLLPGLNFFNRWDNYLSFSLYSGKVSNFYIAIEESELGKIDKRFEKHFTRLQGLQGGEIIDVQRWAISELNVPFTGERRVFKVVGKAFCSMNIPNDHLIFLEIEKSRNGLETISSRCSDFSIRE